MQDTNETNDWRELQIQNQLILDEFIDFRLSKLNKKAQLRLMKKYDVSYISKAIEWDGFDSGVLQWVNFNQDLSWIKSNKNWLIDYKKDTIYKNYCIFNGLPTKFNVNLYWQLGLHCLTK